MTTTKSTTWDSNCKITSILDDVYHHAENEDDDAYDEGNHNRKRNQGKRTARGFPRMSRPAAPKVGEGGEEDAMDDDT